MHATNTSTNTATANTATATDRLFNLFFSGQLSGSECFCEEVTSIEREGEDEDDKFFALVRLLTKRQNHEDRVCNEPVSEEELFGEEEF